MTPPSTAQTVVRPLHLMEAEVRFYREQGYLPLPGLVEAGAVDGLREETLRVVRDYVPIEMDVDQLDRGDLELSCGCTSCHNGALRQERILFQAAPTGRVEGQMKQSKFLRFCAGLALVVTSLTSQIRADRYPREVVDVPITVEDVQRVADGDVAGDSEEYYILRGAFGQDDSFVEPLKRVVEAYQKDDVRARKSMLVLDPLDGYGVESRYFSELAKSSASNPPLFAACVRVLARRPDSSMLRTLSYAVPEEQRTLLGEVRNALNDYERSLLRWNMYKELRKFDPLAIDLLLRLMDVDFVRLPVVFDQNVSRAYDFPEVHWARKQLEEESRRHPARVVERLMLVEQTRHVDSVSDEARERLSHARRSYIAQFLDERAQELYRRSEGDSQQEFE